MWSQGEGARNVVNAELMEQGDLDQRLLPSTNGPPGDEMLVDPIAMPNEESQHEQDEAQPNQTRHRQRIWATSSYASSGQVSEADQKLITRHTRLWRAKAYRFGAILLFLSGISLLSLSSAVNEEYSKRVLGFVGCTCLIGIVSEIILRVIDWLMHKALHMVEEESMQKGLSSALLLFHRIWVNLVVLIWTLLMVLFDVTFARFIPEVWVKHNAEILFKTCFAIFVTNGFRVLSLLLLERMTQDFNSRTYVKRIYDTMIDQWIVCNILNGVSRIKPTRYFQYLLKEMLESEVIQQTVLNQLKAYIRERKVDGKEADLSILHNRKRLVAANDLVMRRANQAFDLLMKKHRLQTSDVDDTSFDEDDVVELDFETFKEATAEVFVLPPWSPEKVWREKLNPSLEDSLCREDFCEMFARLYHNRRHLWASMQDSDSLLSLLDQFALSIVLFFSFMVALAIFDVDFYKMWTALTSFLISMAVFLGPSVVTAAQNLIFLLAVHPFDVGDQIEIGPHQDRYQILRINLLSTVMQRWDGAVCRVENTKIATSALHNYSTSGKRGVARRFDVNLESVTSDFFEKLRENVEEFVLSNPDVYSGEWLCLLRDIHDSLKCTIMVFVEFTYPHVDLTKSTSDEHNFNVFLIKQLKDLGATYTYPIEQSAGEQARFSHT